MMGLLKSGVNLGQASYGKENNLDIIRFIAAVFVIICHSYPLSSGAEHQDFLASFTQGQLNLGGLAVGVFFLFGGFLIAGSMERTKTTGKYFVARSLRIFPALFFVTFSLAFLLGPILTSLPKPVYFSNSGTYRYLLNSILILQHNLPGVFTANIYGATANGPLWTLPIEFFCYVMCYLVYKAGFLKKKTFLITIPFFVLGCFAILYLGRFSPTIITEVRPITLFYIGMGIYLYRDKILLNRAIALLLVPIMLVLFYFGQVNVAVLLLFPYIIFTIGYATKRKLSGFAKHGEFSYGIYLWGWPIQQIICSIFGGSMLAPLNALLALPFAFVMAVISYYLVEKPALKLKKLVV